MHVSLNEDGIENSCRLGDGDSLLENDGVGWYGNYDKL